MSTRSPVRSGRPARGHSGRSKNSRRSLAISPGLRWIPLPLAILAAVVGWLVFGSLLGQSQATVANQPGWVAGGLELTVQQMGWMSNDMTGQGPLALPSGFPMDPGMMPGMQSVNDNRLQVEVDLRNITSRVQNYAKGDFRIVGRGGQSWPFVNIEGSNSVSEAPLRPGFDVTLDLYFDIPIKQSKGLSIEWARGGAIVDFPVSTNGVPTPHHH